jgi:hypothetical protein
LLAAPPIAALCYPLLLKIFHNTVVPPGHGSALLAAALLLLAISVPAVAIQAYARLAAEKSPTRAELNLKRIALLCVGAPPLYTTLGVVVYVVHSAVSDLVLWVIVWGVIAGFGARLAWMGSEPPRDLGAAASARLRFAHGVSAALIVLIFLGLHLTNHAMGLWSPQMHRQVMDLFRLVYRSNLIQPVVIALFLFQAVSGALLLWPTVRKPSDAFRTFQIASGAYLFFYVLGHLNSVFVARVITNTPTDWDWATGAPDGLIHSAWSIRLLPHYLIAVFFVLSHLVLGARGIALAHHTPVARANLLAKTGIALAAVVAIAIMLGLCGLHFAHLRESPAFTKDQIPPAALTGNRSASMSAASAGET